MNLVMNAQTNFILMKKNNAFLAVQKDFIQMTNNVLLAVISAPNVLHSKIALNA
jgi:hypothetical protein